MSSKGLSSQETDGTLNRERKEREWIDMRKSNGIGKKETDFGGNS